jgi:hypothetical protein
VPSTLISTLAAWKTTDFGAGFKPEVTGLGDPALTVSVALKGGKR